MQKKVAVVASVLKRDNEIIAKDVSVEFTLPSLKRGSFQNTGEDETPLLTFDGVMEAKVTAAGVDIRLVDMCAPTKARYKLTGVQQVNDNDGAPNIEKIEFLFTGKGAAPATPGITIGEGGEGEYTVILSRFEQYCAGEGMMIIDRDQDVYKIKDKDYFEEKRNMLN